MENGCLGLNLLNIMFYVDTKQDLYYIDLEYVFKIKFKITSRNRSCDVDKNIGPKTLPPTCNPFGSKDPRLTKNGHCMSGRDCAKLLNAA